MAQHDYNIANQSGADFRSDLNNALSAIASTNSGDTAPATTFANQLWIDTANNVLKIRNEANSAWITTGISITADNTFNIDGGTINGITALSFSSGSSVTTILDEDNLSSDSATALATQQSIKAYVDSQVGSVDTLAEILANGNATSGTDISVSTGDDITFADSSKAIFGDSADLSIQHDATDSSIINTTGDISIINNADNADVVIRSDDGSGGNAVYFRADGSTGSTSMHHYGDKKIETLSQGVAITGNATFDDTSKILLGTSNDLQIFHDGDNSFIKEVGTGDLRLLASAKIDLRSNDDATVMIRANAGGNVDLRYAGDSRLNTTSAGINVDGIIETDGLSINNTTITSTAAELNILDGVTSTTAEINLLDGVTSTTAEINLLDGATANTVVNNKAVIYGSSGEVAGTLSTAAQPNITSLGDLTALTGGTGDFNWNSGNLFIDTSANAVGIGTDSPNRELNIQGAGAVWLQMTTENTTTGTVGLLLGDTNATTKTRIVNDASDNLQFWTGTNEAVRIDNARNLIVAGESIGDDNSFAASSSGNITIARASGSSRTMASFVNGGSTVGSIVTSTTATTYNTSSDYRLKENIDYDFAAIDRVKNLKPCRFNFIADAETTVDGFIAHEVQEIVPEAITGEKDGIKQEEYVINPAVLDDSGNVVTEAETETREVPEYQGIDQSKLVPLLTKAIQEQQAQIESLQAQINDLKGE
jgi:hypothetical protein